MSRLIFDKQGKLEKVDGAQLKVDGLKLNPWLKNQLEENKKEKLKKTEEKILRVIKPEQDKEFWSLYKKGKKLEPLKFSNGKTQEDIVKEIIDLIKQGKKCIFLHGMCGTGKSAIALNIARILGKSSIIVPIKNLQKQYEEDYMGEMFVAKKTGEEMKIDIITGRDNHDSIFFEGENCNYPFLPEIIQITEKNSAKLKGYYEENPFIKNKEIENVKKLKRISIAPANPYWSPIIPAEYEVNLRDAVKKRYQGLREREFIFYHRKNGCSYYDQYQAYLNADAIIFNSAKYKIEVALDRKPATNVDIIDECDEFLDSFSNQTELNLTRLSNSLKHIASDDYSTNKLIETIIELISLEEKRIKAIGFNEKTVIHVQETNIAKILQIILKDRNLESEISLDENSYANTAVEAAKQFTDFLDETYLSYRKNEDNLIANLVTTNLSKRLEEVMQKGKAFVFMSGTLHSQNVLKNVFGINDFVVVEAEANHQGEIEIIKTGMEFDCSHKNLKSNGDSREKYLKALQECVVKAPRPLLIHVNAFEDLPSKEEISKFKLKNIMSKEELINLQSKDKNSELVSMFKNGLNDVLYSTKCSRGVDFPGDMCRAMIFTKYPNPNVQNTFWKILNKTHPNHYWDFYKDKARREFLQRLYRALRKKDDHVFVLSPDSRILDKVRELQLGVLQ